MTCTAYAEPDCGSTLPFSLLATPASVPVMPLTPYCTAFSGFWQRRADVPLTCPVCEDYRHPLPPDGYTFLTPDDVHARVAVKWRTVRPGITMFWNEPQIGIGPCGYIIERPDGNIAFEGTTWYDAAALEHIKSLGGLRYLSASHAHVYGALWQLVDHFAPEVVLHHASLNMAQAFSVSWPFDERAELLPGAVLYHTGGHTPGHTVLHLEDERTLFCGDALKYEIEGGGPIGRPTTVSCHKAFDAHIPLTHADVRRYRDVMEPLAFDAVITPWEVVTEGGKEAALRLFAAQLAGRPFANRMSTSVLSEPAPDAPPPDPESVHRYRTAMPPGTTMEFPITELDRVGEPIWTLAHWPGDGTMNTAVGYGPTDNRARIGAWGELFEKASAHGVTEGLPQRIGSYHDLKAGGVPVLDPLRLRLPVTTTYTPDQPLAWVEAQRYPSGQPIWIPKEEAAAYPADLHEPSPRDDGWLYTPITNGLGAGDTFERALAHGLLELVQRDGNSVNYRALDRGIGIELDSIADASIRHLLTRFDEAGIDVIVKLADTSFGMANLYIVGAERDLNRVPFSLMVTGCGEGVHPDREKALGKALREFASSRARKRFNLGPIDPMVHLFPEGYMERVRDQPAPNEEARAFQAMNEWLDLDTKALYDRIEPTLHVEDTVRFSSLPTVAPGTLGGPTSTLNVVAERVEREGLEIIYVDYTPAGSTAHAVKAIVPGLEVETTTYYRIGLRNLRRLLDRGSDIVGLGPPPAGAHRIPLPAADEDALGDSAWFSVERMDAAVDGLYAMYREPRRHVTALAREETARSNGTVHSASPAAPRRA